MKPKTWDELVEGVGRVWSGFRAWCKSTRSPVWAGTVPQCMAAFRNLAIGLLRTLGATNIAAATRRYAAQPTLALAALGLTADFE